MVFKLLLVIPFLLFSVTSVKGQGSVYDQCGGDGWTGGTDCGPGLACVFINQYYSQCLLSGTGTGVASPTTYPVITPVPPITQPATITEIPTGRTTCSSPLPTSTTCPSPSRPTSPPLAGVAISGFEFGCDASGNCDTSQAAPPLTEYGGADGVGQMQHFASDDGFGVFRLPVTWQYLTNGVLTGTLDPTNAEKYDTLVQACLATGASCIIDLHNNARWNGQIIGQGGPNNTVFADLWTSIATKYASQTTVIFGIMNSPKGIPDVTLWRETVQAAVDAIYYASGSEHYVLLPGNNWDPNRISDSFCTYDSLGSVYSPGYGYSNLIFDIELFLDSDESGTNAECTSNGVGKLQDLASRLRCTGRRGFVTQTGGGNTASCVSLLCQEVEYVLENGDVFLGYVGWAAGSYNSSYALSETPTLSGSTWTDTLLVSSCLSPKANLL